MLKNILPIALLTLASPAIAEPIYPTAENPIANATVITADANCRRSPSTMAPIVRKLQDGAIVSLDIRTAVPSDAIGRFGGNRWIFEYSRACWMHESVIYWMEDGDRNLHRKLPIDQ